MKIVVDGLEKEYFINGVFSKNKVPEDFKIPNFYKIIEIPTLEDVLKAEMEFHIIISVWKFLNPTRKEINKRLENFVNETKIPPSKHLAIYSCLEEEIPNEVARSIIYNLEKTIDRSLRYHLN